jgi:hypothetical protein
MKVRQFREYLNANAENEIRAWLLTLPSRARAKIQARIAFLENDKWEDLRP